MAGVALPRGMIDLNSTEGQILLKEACRINKAMIDHHKKQVNETYCGAASLALICNSINAAYRIKYMLLPGGENQKEAEDALVEAMGKGPITVTEDDILKCIDDEIINSTKQNTEGLTFLELFTFAMHLGFGINCYFTYDEKNDKSTLTEEKRKELNEKVKESDMFLVDTLKEFRTRLVRHIAHEGRDRQIQGVIINCDMQGLEYEKGPLGHFSPVAGYHESRDMVLVMDVWPTTVMKWVPVKVLWEAMSKSIDTCSGLPRGFMHIYELM